MINSIPVLAAEIGMDFQDYENLAKNIGRMLLISKEKRQRILDRANTELSPELRKKGKTLVKSMAYDRGFFKEAGLNYSQGPPKGQGIFITTLADYLLRNKEKFT